MKNKHPSKPKSGKPLANVSGKMTNKGAKKSRDPGRTRQIGVRG